MKKIILTIAFALCATVFSKAQAYDWVVEAKVTYVQGSYLPTNASFRIDTNASTACPAGTWMSWTGNFHGVNQTANVKMVYSMLLTAFVTGKKIKLYGYDSYDGTACLGEYIHIIED